MNDIETKIDRIAQAESPMQKYLLQIITIVFLAGGGYATLSTVSAMAEDNKAQIAAEVEKTNEIDKKLVRIETKQNAIEKKVDKAADTAEANSRKLDRILDKLEDD